MAKAVIPWYGGKASMVSKILPLLPVNKVYCEPFGGGASVLLHRPMAHTEIYNDTDARLVNVFRMLQDPERNRELVRKLKFTPYSRAEYERAWDAVDGGAVEGVDAAWAFLVFISLNIGNVPDTRRGGNRGSWSRHTTQNKAAGWARRKERIAAAIDRLSNVQIECTDGVKLIAYVDSPDTTFYVDPPYVHDTRAGRLVYSNEPDADWHVLLIDTLLACRGAVLLSGHDHPIYQRLDDAGWRRSEHAAYGQVSSQHNDYKGRTEVLWTNQT